VTLFSTEAAILVEAPPLRFGLLFFLLESMALCLARFNLETTLTLLLNPCLFKQCRNFLDRPAYEVLV